MNNRLDESLSITIIHKLFGKTDKLSSIDAEKLVKRKILD